MKLKTDTQFKMLMKQKLLFEKFNKIDKIPARWTSKKKTRQELLLPG